MADSDLTVFVNDQFCQLIFQEKSCLCSDFPNFSSAKNDSLEAYPTGSLSQKFFHDLRMGQVRIGQALATAVVVEGQSQVIQAKGT